MGRLLDAATCDEIAVGHTSLPHSGDASFDDINPQRVTPIAHQPDPDGTYPRARVLTLAERRARQSSLAMRRRAAPAEEFARRALLVFRVWRARLEAGLTQSELARRIGRGQRLVSDLENGTCDLTLSTLFALARELELEPSALIDATPLYQREGDDERETKLYNRARAEIELAQRRGQPAPALWDTIEKATGVARKYRRDSRT